MFTKADKSERNDKPERLEIQDLKEKDNVNPNKEKESEIYESKVLTKEGIDKLAMKYLEEPLNYKKYGKY